MQSPVPSIGEIPFLRDLPIESAELLASCARERRFRPPDLLLREGEAAETFHILLEGRVAIEVQGEASRRICIQTLEPGDVVGWSWLMKPYVWHFDARCRSSTRTLELNARKTRRLMDKDAHFGYELLKALLPIIASRLECARLQLLDLYGGDAEAGQESP